jgi:hypothetical protein
MADERNFRSGPQRASTIRTREIIIPAKIHLSILFPLPFFAGSFFAIASLLYNIAMKKTRCFLISPVEERRFGLQTAVFWLDLGGDLLLYCSLLTGARMAARRRF